MRCMPRPMDRIWRVESVRGLWRCLALCLLLGAWPQRADAQTTLWTADMLLRDVDDPPGEADAGWRRVDLPHALQDDDRRAAGAWFRFHLPDATQGPEQAAYLYWANENAAFYFNGSFIGDGGRLRDPIARHWNLPFYFLLPRVLWRPTGNQLWIHLRSDPGWGLLSPLTIGPATDLHRTYESRRFLQIELARGLGIALLLASSLALSAWWWRKQDRQYLWFGLACLSWSVFSFYQGMHEPPLPPALLRWLAHLCLDAWTVCLTLFVLRQLNLASPRLERALFAFLLLVAVLSTPHGLFWQGAAFFVSHGLFGVFAIVLTLCLRRKLRPHPLLFGCLLVLILASFHDLFFAIPWHWFPTWFHPIQLTHRFFAAHYAAPLVLLVLTRTLARRFVQSLVETETLNRELESRVAASTQALADSYARRSQMERQTAAHAERERIYRDLHDDLGAMLLSLSIRAKDPRDAELARSALRNLRDVVSQAGQQQFPLHDLLADWRAEISGRLHDAGLNLHWQQAEDLPNLAVSATAALHLGRILREAISNVVHHARASQVTLQIDGTESLPPMLQVTVSDDGTARAQAPGRGMRNMRSRAALLQGTVTWDFGEHGCRVQLALPQSGLTCRPPDAQ